MVELGSMDRIGVAARLRRSGGRWRLWMRTGACSRCLLHITIACEHPYKEIRRRIRKEKIAFKAKNILLARWGLRPRHEFHELTRISFFPSAARLDLLTTSFEIEGLQRGIPIRNVSAAMPRRVY